MVLSFKLNVSVYFILMCTRVIYSVKHYARVKNENKGLKYFKEVEVKKTERKEK